MLLLCVLFVFKQKTAYEMRISDWSSDVCSSDLNGLNDIGYGAESAGMAGADLAVTGDPSALNINPAGLARIDNHAFNLGIEPFYFIDNHHRDQFGNDQKPANPFGAIFSGGYAQRLADRSEEHTSELQSLMRISSAVFCLKK